MTFAAAETARRSGMLPRRTVVVTFDDGYASTLAAKPVLDSLGWPATVFVVTDFVTSGRPLCWPGIEQWARTPYSDELTPLSWDELAALTHEGWEVGSHTATHPQLDELSDAAVCDELERSRAAVTARLGDCSTIAYPYGAYDRRVARAAAAAGYLAACTLPTALRPDEPHMRPRVGLYANDLGIRLWLKTADPPLALRRSRLAAVLARG